MQEQRHSSVMRLGRKSKPRKQPTRNPPATGGLRRPANEPKSILSAPREEICTLTRIPYFNKTRRANSNKISLRFNPPRWQGLQTMGQPISGAPRPFSDHSPRSLRQATRKRIRKHSERVSSKNIFWPVGSGPPGGYLCRVPELMKGSSAPGNHYHHKRLQNVIAGMLRCAQLRRTPGLTTSARVSFRVQHPPVGLFPKSWIQQGPRCDLR